MTSWIALTKLEMWKEDDFWFRIGKIGTGSVDGQMILPGMYLILVWSISRDNGYILTGNSYQCTRMLFFHI